MFTKQSNATNRQTVRDGKVKDGDYSCTQMHGIPTVLQLKYMAELLKVKIKIGGMWHACSYDPKILGRLIGNKLG